MPERTFTGNFFGQASVEDALMALDVVSDERGTGRRPRPLRARPGPAAPSAGSPQPELRARARPESQVVDLERRRDVLKARVAELQWDLGGLVYEMAIRDRIRVDVLVKRAALLQDADSELGEIERILRPRAQRHRRRVRLVRCPAQHREHRTAGSAGSRSSSRSRATRSS